MEDMGGSEMMYKNGKVPLRQVYQSNNNVIKQYFLHCSQVDGLVSRIGFLFFIFLVSFSQKVGKINHHAS